MIVNIRKINILKCYEGLMIGKPKESLTLELIENSKALSNQEYPIVNLYEEKWTQETDKTGSYGHIANANLEIITEENSDTFAYDFNLIFNLHLTENLHDKINEILNYCDWKNIANKEEFCF